MKSIILFVFLSLFSLYLTTADDNRSTFLKEIDNNYKEYGLYEEYTDDYYFIVVSGIYKDKKSFGVSLNSFKKKAYTIKIEINGETYYLEEDEKGNVNAPLVGYSENKDITIYVCTTGRNSKIVSEHKLDFNFEYEGYNLQSLKYSSLISVEIIDANFQGIIIILTVIISICAIIITFLAIFKKGVFNPNHKHQDDLVLIDSDNDEVDIEETKEIENSFDSAYDKDYYIAKEKEYFEDEKEIDIRPLLIEKGFVSDYSLMSEEEKNQVMIYLMTLRHDGIISEKQCHDEEVKLWRKY